MFAGLFIPQNHRIYNFVCTMTEHIDFSGFQILQKDITGHREHMVGLDKLGTHLKYFSQKQDVILIKNLLMDSQHRWEKVVSRSAQRTRQLDHGYKDAKQVSRK